MSAVVSAIGDAIGGVVEAVGDVVEGVGDVLSDVGEAIDDYVIQPILDDPLTAIATVAGAAVLGPMIAPSLGALGGAAGAVGAGLGAAAGNTTAGLVQGEEFDEALKGGVIAGLTAGVTKGAFDYFGSDSAASSLAPDEAITPPVTDPLDDLLARTNNFADVDVGLPGGTGATTSIVPPPPSLEPTLLNPVDDLTATAANPVDDIAANVANPVDDVAAASTSTAPAAPVVPSSPLTNIASAADDSFAGLKVPKFDPNAALPRDLAGNIDYSLTAGMKTTGPGLQMPSSPNISAMGGGQGLLYDVPATPAFTYSMDSIDPSIRGMSDTWFGDSGQVYGNASPAGKIGQFGFTPDPQQIQYAAGPQAATRTLTDKLKNFDFGDINKGDVSSLAGKVVDYAIENPLTTLAGITLATGALTQGAPPSAQPQPGSTRDSNFNRPMDIYNYLREQQLYGGDLTRYGQSGGEHRFFTPSKFELVPRQAARGGLMQFANGGQVPPQMQRRPMPGGVPNQGMGALMQAMQTGNMPPAGGQGRGMPSGMVSPQGQGMPQGRPQPMNRNPKTSYYQYGTPPAKMAAGGALNMVRSYNIGGGADGRSDDVNAVLSDGEYVFDAETVALLGNGSSEAGADRLDEMRAQIRKQKGQSLAKGKISPDARSPLSYLKRS